MEQKLSSELPQALQNELKATITALEKKYGANAVMVGTFIENLSNMCVLLSRMDLTGAQRETAFRMSRQVCGDVIRALGELSNVKPNDAFAVAEALQDYSRHAEAELCGVTVPEPVMAEAADVIAKAAKPTLH